MVNGRLVFIQRAVSCSKERSRAFVSLAGPAMDYGPLTMDSSQPANSKMGSHSPVTPSIPSSI